jgi:voltage-gated potassium channel Kch
MSETAKPKLADGLRRSTDRARLRLGALRFSVAQFLVSLVLLFVTEPFVEQISYGRIIEAALLTLVLLSAVPAIGGGRRTLIWAIVLVIPAIGGKWANYATPGRFAPEAGLVPALAFVLFVVFHLLRFILRAPRVNSEVLCAGISTYLMLGLIWTFAYILVARMVPNSFVFTASTESGQSIVGFNGLYFSLITLTTVGYGDIVPLSPAARMLAMTEAMTGTIYVAVLISRLVALHSSARASEERK